MQPNYLSSTQSARWVYLFIFMHCLVWTLAPIIARSNLPLDSIEGSVWGHQLEWGYDKNPFMNGWLTALATYLGGQSGWMIYLFSQLSVIICLYMVWKLAAKMLSPIQALIAVLILEGMQYYNFHAIDFNDNTLELSLWALAIYFFYTALRSPSNRAWLFTGVFAGLAMMTKYYTAALLASMFLLMLSQKELRKQFATHYPYLAIGSFILICLPHTLWLFQHEFVTINYVFERTSSKPSWTNHFFYPAQFALQQFEVIIPALLVFSLLYLGKSTPSLPPTSSLKRFDKQFLLYIGLGPFLLTILLAFALGIKLRAGWGMPLLSLWGIILVGSVKLNLTQLKLRRFIYATFGLMFALAAGYAFSLLASSDESSANYPGKEIAQTINEEWRAQFGTPLAYVAGSRWVGGNIQFYSTDHPTVYMDWDKQKSTWINEADLEKKGAVFVWDAKRKSLPPEVIARFPRLQAATVREFNLQHNQHSLAPVKVGIAILPPLNQEKTLALNN